MARCGRCGLWNKYPDTWHEEKWAGVCVYYQLRLREDDVFAERDCQDFIERIPEISAMEHFDYKLKHENLGDAYTVAKRSRRIAYIALGIALIEFTWSMLSKFGM